MAWRERFKRATADAYVPLSFAPGEAYQFDWSHEKVELAGVPATVKVAHVRLCHSRTVLHPGLSARDAGDGVRRPRPGLRVLRRACLARGIYDNMKTAVDTVFVGKERRSIAASCRCAGTTWSSRWPARRPRAGRRGRSRTRSATCANGFFTPRLRFAELRRAERLAGGRCLAWARDTPIRSTSDRTRLGGVRGRTASLIAYRGSRSTASTKLELRCRKTCLVRFDHNRYSVSAKAARPTAQLRAYADRIVVRCDGEVVGEHPRRFGRDHTVYDPWHYLPVLARKPGALRNGAAVP